MSACIGWTAEPRCPVYGALHGCELEDGHNDGGHVGHQCVCGATTRTRDLPIDRANRGNGAGWAREKSAVR